MRRLRLLLGGGVITNVTETDDGIKLTVTNSAGSKDYELHNGKNGENGEKGDDLSLIHI